jgi:transposase
MAKHMSPYPPQFRAEAIQLARTSGKPHAQLARGLGITSETLRLWLKQADLDEGKRRDGLTSDEQEELRRLRRENVVRLGASARQVVVHRRFGTTKQVVVSRRRFDALPEMGAGDAGDAGDAGRWRLAGPRTGLDRVGTACAHGGALLS